LPEKPGEPRVVTLPLKDLRFPKDSLIGAVIRGDEVIIGSGETVLRPGDELLVVARPEALARLERLLS
jgi:trk system potassium uptake protein TrkA